MENMKWISILQHIPEQHLGIKELALNYGLQKARVSLDRIGSRESGNEKMSADDCLSPSILS